MSTCLKKQKESSFRFCFLCHDFLFVFFVTTFFLFSLRETGFALQNNFRVAKATEVLQSKALYGAKATEVLQSKALYGAKATKVIGSLTPPMTTLYKPRFVRAVSCLLSLGSTYKALICINEAFTEDNGIQSFVL